MKKISVILILCLLFNGIWSTTYAGIYDSYEGVSGTLTASGISNVNPGDEVTVTISVDKDEFENIVAFDILGSLTNLTVKSLVYLPSQRPSQFFTNRTTNKTIDLSGFFNPTEAPVSATGNSFQLFEITVTADAVGSASFSISDGYVQFGFDDDSMKRKLEVSDLSFSVVRRNNGGNNSRPSTVTPPPVEVEPPVEELPLKWENPFDDINEADWFYASVEYANTNNLMKGVTENIFSPNTSVTRAMFVTVLYRMEGEPEAGECVFEDVPSGAYYEKAVAWASANKIVNGVTAELFSPDDNITREQMAAIVYRYATYKNADLSVGENTNILSYEDFADISEYAIPAFQYMAGEGIMKGETETTLNPKNISTRAQAATVFMRVMEKLK